MATKKETLVFTKEEQELAAKIRERARMYNYPIHIYNIWEAVKYFGYASYREVPTRVKQCISALGGKRSGIAKRRSAKIKVVPKK